ncbi:hypothetical protein A3Q56_06319 [Intoshia linei]|uniref:Uncharacterized protein n=1 Tax=Intoshia linei TaxID=1819745 RepID=A0A177AV48_9BILA|nr:hypothetical protein A3Q56_06319 [Intoshia linei]
MTKSKTLALVIVLNISSLIHEYIIALTFGFFVPILMISYSFFGAIMAILPELRYGNIMVLGSFMFGINFFLTFYSLEYIQREKMIGLYDGYLNYIVPYIVH